MMVIAMVRRPPRFVLKQQAREVSRHHGKVELSTEHAYCRRNNRIRKFAQDPGIESNMEIAMDLVVKIVGVQLSEAIRALMEKTVGDTVEAAGPS